MEIPVSPAGWMLFGGNRRRCALGRAGAIAAKREGDGGTPVGLLPLRRVFYRADRLAPPATGLALRPLAPDDGWCDAPADLAYNRLVKHPWPASAERLWRADGLYDVVVELGWNDAPIVPGRGSAIFLHVARPDWGPTEGCVALGLPDLLALLALCRPGDALRVG